MAKLRINGDSSGYVDLSAPNAASSSTLDLDQVPQKNATTTAFTGNVAIGETSPDRQLHVKSGATNVVAKFESTDGTAAVEFTDPAGSAEVGTNAGAVVFYPSGAEKARISTQGYLTTPHQPGFSYLGSKAHDIQTTGTQVMTSANVWSASVNHAFNRGNHFNASTGRFTAPAAGTYHFQFQCMAATFSSGYLWFYMDINGATKSYMQMPQQAELNAMVHHMYCELAVGDYVHCSWTNNYNSGWIHYPGFSGYLVG